MPANNLQLVFAVLAMVLLTFVVGLMMLRARVAEMRHKRVHPQSVSTSGRMAARLEDTRAADNFRNLLEVPVLFYALVAVALATAAIPDWLVWGAWLFVALRVLHSAIHCSYNRVMHRLAAFLVGFGVLLLLWVAWVLHLAGLG